jgi:hypothetical protein
MRWVGPIAVTLILLSAMGCAETRRTQVVCRHKTGLSSLLFDALPGLPTASQIAYRSQWPSATSFQPLVELVEYRELFIDRQGDGFGHRGGDHTYRRFETRRVGYGQR